MKAFSTLTALLALLGSLSTLAAEADKPQGPPANPALATSSKPISHNNHNFTALAGPRGPSRRLREDEVLWKPIGPVNWLPLYSAPYPNGKRVIWTGGGIDRIVKFDADTMETLATYASGGNYLSEDEIRRNMDKLDHMSDADYTQWNVRNWRGYYRKAVGVAYRLLSKDNELYVPFVGDDGKFALRIYGDDNTDPASAIVLRREWKVPTDISTSQPASLSMIPDGTLIYATTDGTLIALSRDLKVLDVLHLPRIDPNIETKDFWLAFLRNNISNDDQGGLYVVTRDYMHRVQWTGSKFSLDGADGAWSARYPNENGAGSGTTPGLMGWGPKEDHLVVITDGSNNNIAMALWRDKIPDDWKGIAGMDRRVAGVAPIHFGVSPDEHVLVENSPVIYGYSAFFDNHYPLHPTMTPPTKVERSLTDSFSMHVPGKGAMGGAQVRWDPQTRTLKLAWNSQLNLMSTVCAISGPTELLYCLGNRNREFTLEGLDWNTGKSVFTYTLGKSKRYQILGGWIDIAPNGDVDCGCAGGQGLVRMKVNGKTAKQK